MADFYKEHEEMVKWLEDFEDQMTDAENAVCDVLCGPDVIDTYPKGFFDKSVKELNEWLGGEGDMVVTPNVKKYMKVFKKWNDESNEMASLFYDMDDDGTNMDSADDAQELSEEDQKEFKELIEDIGKGGLQFIPDNPSDEDMMMLCGEDASDALVAAVRAWIMENKK